MGAGTIIRFTNLGSEFSGLLLSRLLSDLKSAETKVQAENMLKLLGVHTKQKERGLLTHFRTKDESLIDLKAMALTILLCNRGAVAIQTVKRLGEQKLTAGLEKNTSQVLTVFYREGLRLFTAERKKSGQLIEQNTFPLERSGEQSWLSLFSKEDETRLKKFFSEPPKDEKEIEVRESFYRRLDVLIKLAETLIIPTLYSKGWSGKIITLGAVTFFPQLNYIRKALSRRSLSFKISQAGILEPTIGSLLIRLTVACVKKEKDDLWKHFSKQEDGSFKFSEQLNPEQSKIKQLARQGDEGWENAYQIASIYQIAETKKIISLLISALAVSSKDCYEFTLISQEKETIEQTVPTVAKMVQAIIESSLFARLELASNRPQLSEDDLIILSDEFLSRLQKLKEEVIVFFGKEMTTKIFSGHTTAFWQRRVILSDDDSTENRLLPGDRPLTIKQICELTELDEVLFYISNIHTWPQRDQRELVRSFSWQPFLERGSAEQFWKLYQLLTPTRLIGDSGEIKQGIDWWQEEVWQKFNWERKRVDTQLLVNLWELIWDQPVDLKNQLLTAAEKIYLTVPRFKSIQLPQRNDDLPLDDLPKRHPLALIWLKRLEQEGKINWDKMADQTAFGWIDHADETILWWFIIQRVSAGQLATWLKKYVPTVRLCPTDQQLSTAWAQAIWRLEAEARAEQSRAVVSKIGTTIFYSKTAFGWYQETAKKSPKNAVLIEYLFHDNN